MMTRRRTKRIVAPTANSDANDASEYETTADSPPASDTEAAGDATLVVDKTETEEESQSDTEVAASPAHSRAESIVAANRREELAQMPRYYDAETTEDETEPPASFDQHVDRSADAERTLTRRILCVPLAQRPFAPDEIGGAMRARSGAPERRLGERQPRALSHVDSAHVVNDSIARVNAGMSVSRTEADRAAHGLLQGSFQVQDDATMVNMHYVQNDNVSRCGLSKTLVRPSVCPSVRPSVPNASETRHESLVHIDTSSEAASRQARVSTRRDTQAPGPSRSNDETQLKRRPGSVPATTVRSEGQVTRPQERAGTESEQLYNQRMARTAQDTFRARSQHSPATQRRIETTGAATTLRVNQELKQQGFSWIPQQPPARTAGDAPPTPIEAMRET